MKVRISYDNLTRIETYPLQQSAVREVIYNAFNIANAFFRAGYVETWGCGIEKIREACKKHGVPDPEYMLHPGDIMIKFTPLQVARSYQ